MDIALDFSLMIGLTVALTEVVKRLFGMTDELSKRFLPAFALVFGVIMSGFWLGRSFESFVMGLVIGLSASGLFSSGKAVLGK